MRYPNQLEADLAFRGIDIGWWHRYTLDSDGFPKLSSRRLLALIEALDADSAYRTAQRDGNWPPTLQILKSIHKESALQTAAKYEDYTAEVFLDPVEQRERLMEAIAEDEFQEEAEEEFMETMGWV